MYDEVPELRPRDGSVLRYEDSSIQTQTRSTFRHQRNVNMSVQEYEQAGKELFANMYGETASDVQSMLDAIYPDMGMC